MAAPTGRFAPHGPGVPKRKRENAQKVEVRVVLEARILRGLICGTFYLRKRWASFPPVGKWHPKTTLTSKKRALSCTRNGTPPGGGSQWACPRLDSGRESSFSFARWSRLLHVGYTNLSRPSRPARRHPPYVGLDTRPVPRKPRLASVPRTMFPRNLWDRLCRPCSRYKGCDRVSRARLSLPKLPKKACISHSRDDLFLYVLYFRHPIGVCQYVARKTWTMYPMRCDLWL